MWDKIGIAYHQLGDLNAARKAYEHAIKLDKKYADAINNVGTVFYAEKKYRSAISRYNQALQYCAGFRVHLEQSRHRLVRSRQIRPDDAGLHEGAPARPRGVRKARHRSAPECWTGASPTKPAITSKWPACTPASGKNELALQYLRKALEEGFKEKEKLQQAKEFAALRETQEFKDLMTLEPRVL